MIGKEGPPMSQPLPRVLLLGDSIRGSYQPLVADALKGEAQVVGPAENCQYSLYTLSSLDRWLGQLGKPDVVHWNNGLHDVMHSPLRFPAQIPIEMYRANLEFILGRLLETGARVIWATITPVHPDAPFHTDRVAWRNAEIDQYNKAALDLMQGRGVPIDDLHAIVASDPDKYLCEDQLHLSEAGKAKCAEAVADAVRRVLRSLR